MSDINILNNDVIPIENIDIRHLTINAIDPSTVNEKDHENLLINEYAPNTYSVIGGRNGLGIDVTRQEYENSMADKGLLVKNNIVCSGTIFTSNLQIYGTPINDDNTFKILELINNRDIPIFPSTSVPFDMNGMNYSFPHYFTIGSYGQSEENTHSLNISRDTAGNKVSRLQLCLKSQGAGTEMLMGMVGNDTASPAIIYTSQGKPLELFVGKDKSTIEATYNNGIDYASNIPRYAADGTDLPSMSIDADSVVCIGVKDGKNILEQIKQQDDVETDTNEIGADDLRLAVSAMAYIRDLYVYESSTSRIMHTDDVYIKKVGFTLEPSQIYPGSFTDGSFEFTSNVTICDLSVSHTADFAGNVVIHSNLQVGDNDTNEDDTMEVFMNASFRGGVSVQHTVQTGSINVLGSIQKDGRNVNVIDVDVLEVDRHPDNIYSNVLRDVLAEETTDVYQIAEVISTQLEQNGTNGIVDFLTELDGIDTSNVTTIALKLVTNIEKTNTGSILSYARSSTINLNGPDIVCEGRIAVGVDGVDGVEYGGNRLTIVKGDELDAEIKLKNNNQSALIGHTDGNMCFSTNNHNAIAFYPSREPSIQSGFQLVKPSMIMKRDDETGKQNLIGINNNTPAYTLDVAGDLAVSGEILRHYVGGYRKVVDIIENDLGGLILTEQNKPIILHNESVEVKGSISVLGGIYEGEERLLGFKQTSSNRLYNVDGNISIGYGAGTLPLSSVSNTALIVRNAEGRTADNNSVIRIMQSPEYFENTMRYSGIDICKNPRNIEDRWYMYNKHIDNSFEIGLAERGLEDHVYMRADKEVATGNHRLTFNNDVTMNGSLTLDGGDLTIKNGDINLEGEHSTIKINGIELNSNTIKISTLTSPTDNEGNGGTDVVIDGGYELSLKDNDILLQGSKIVSLVDNQHSLYFGYLEDNNKISGQVIQHLDRVDADPSSHTDGRVTVLSTGSHRPIMALRSIPDNTGNAEAQMRMSIQHKKGSSGYDRLAPWKERYSVDFTLQESNPINGLEKFSCALSGEEVLSIEKKSSDSVTYTLGYGEAPALNDLSDTIVHIFSNRSSENTTCVVLNNNEGVSIALKDAEDTWNINSVGNKFSISNSSYEPFSVSSNSLVIHKRVEGTRYHYPSTYSLEVNNEGGDTINGCLLLRNYLDAIETTDSPLLHDVYLSNIAFVVESAIKHDKETNVVSIDYTDYDYTKGTMDADLYIKKMEHPITTDQVYSKSFQKSVNIPVRKHQVSFTLSGEAFQSNVINIDLGDDYKTQREVSNSQARYTLGYHLDTTLEETLTTNTPLEGMESSYGSIYTVLNSPPLVNTALHIDTRSNIEYYTDGGGSGGGSGSVIKKYTIDYLLNKDGYDMDDYHLSDHIAENYNIDVDGAIFITTIERRLFVQDNIILDMNMEVIGDIEQTIQTQLITLDGLTSNNMLKTNDGAITMDDRVYHIDVIHQGYQVSFPALFISFPIDSVDWFDTPSTFEVEYQIYHRDTDDTLEVSTQYLDNNRTHIVMETVSDPAKSNAIYRHYIKSNNGSLSIYAERDGLYNNNVLNITEEGNLYVRGNMEAKDIVISGRPFTEYQEIVDKILNTNLNEIQNNDGTTSVSCKNDGGVSVHTTNHTYMFQNGAISIRKDTVDNEGLVLGYENDTVRLSHSDGIDILKSYYNSFDNTPPSISIHGEIDLKENVTARKDFDIYGGINQLSDRRVKENIRVIDNPLDKLERLEGVFYKNTMTGRDETGLIAQDVEKVLPEVVHEVNGYKTINYGNMIGLLIECMKDIKNILDIKK